MGTFSLLYLIDEINQHIDSHETLDIQLQQAQALARVGGIVDFEQLSNPVIHHYLWALTDVLEQAVQLSDHAFERLRELAKILETVDGTQSA